MAEYNELLDSAHIKFVHSCARVPLNNRHWHKENIIEDVEKIYYIRKGKCEIFINGEKYIVCAGEMILIPSNSLLSFRLVSEKIETEQDFLHFDAKIGTKSIFDFIKFDSMSIEVEDEIAGYYFDEFERKTGDPLIDMLQKRAILIEIILYFIKKAKGRFHMPSNTKNISFDRILDYINQHIIDSECTVSLLAKKANVNINHFIREFKKQYGITPGKYLESLRMERIKKMLIETHCPVNIIASSLGYSSYEVMSKAFKKCEGISPSDYRMLHKKPVNRDTFEESRSK